MRLILTLKAKKSIDQKSFDNKYHTAMHGFLYDKLQNEFPNLHQERNYGYFCFGNLFPIQNKVIKEEEIYKVVISSALPQIIEALFFSLTEGEIVNLGEGSFSLESFMIKNVLLKRNSLIENLYPINLTAHKEDKIVAVKYEDNIFLESLRRNLLRKYNYFFPNDSIDENFNLFENVEIIPYEKKKEASFPIYFYNKEKNDKFDVIGSKLLFKFNNINETQLKIFQCCFDAGFGERTTYGAGFMVVRWKK